MKIRMAMMVGGGIVVILLVAFLAGAVPNPFDGDGDRPPCDQLGSKAEAEAALASHESFVATLTRAGSGIKVAVATPCGGQDRALIRVMVRSAAERDRVSQILRNGDGFGVPVEVITK